VDDERDTYELLKTGMQLYRTGEFQIHYVEHPNMAVEAINARCYDACVLDIRLKGFSGLNLGDLIREHDVNVPLAYLTGLDTEVARAEATRQRAFFWPKQRFSNPKELIHLLGELVSLNPCVEGKRLDNHGFMRQLPTTPIEIPAVLRTLVAYSQNKASAQAA